ncbi:hypothetical protein EOT10_18360 [Streptomyces antnestii]|uniref:PASTA domain-containing protein n=1 Tax=Streptomyces antnestii TaxID=2494256 RepID=A0A3S2XU25_9ACTN|nr:hypothetical protein [Streptomyces sp. San01]RVU23033.1 hypothetical protein EOT10_18360 [Streptomyces sp. San01]
MRGPLSTLWRPRALCGAGTVALLVFLPASAGAAGAAGQDDAAGGDCPVTATAQGVQVTVSASNDTLLSAPAGVGVPAAESCVDYAVGESSGWAGSPYPGETVISAPALLGGQTGQKFPGYPLYAASKYPSDGSAQAGQDPHVMRAHSTKTSTRAEASTVLGQDGTGASTRVVADTSVDPGTLTGTAKATADTRPWSVNGVLELGRVLSSASATADRHGKLVRHSELTVGRTRIAGQTVEITPDGLKALGRTTKLPGVPGVPGGDPAAALNKALSAAGVRIRYLDEKRTAHGVESAGIEVQARQQDTQSGAVYTLTYVFGRASAAAGRVEPPPHSGGLPPVGAPQAPSGAGGGGHEAPGAQAPAGGGAPAPKTPSGDAGPAAPPKDTPPVQLAANPTDMGVTGLYIVLAFGAVATFAGGTLLRLLGVKTRWTS